MYPSNCRKPCEVSVLDLVSFARRINNYPATIPICYQWFTNYKSLFIPFLDVLLDATHTKGGCL